MKFLQDVSLPTFDAQPDSCKVIETIDMHTGGEPLRIITKGLPDIKGKTILEKRKYFKEHFDDIRTGLMFEPRGHADMYGAIITPPCSEDADFGTFFIHNEGYSTMCGHAIIALTKFVLETGLIKKEGDVPELVIDAPPGKIYSKAHIKDNIVERVSFRNVPSFLYLKDQIIDVPGIGNIHFDVAYGGAFYVFCKSEELGLKLVADEYNKLIDYGRKIKYAVRDKFDIKHPFEEDLSFLYGTIIIGEPLNKEHHSRNVCIFAEGEVDRSPTGSGVSARAAIHFARGEIQKNERITIESLLDTLMTVKVVDKTKYGQYEAVIPEVSGTAFFTGQNKFCFDPEDKLNKGFIFR
ncbi:MAG: proline racemase family protein [Desulfobacteraceae bacterium]|nr:proline racemase family protein [Desulfobacteraceae bacterium]